ncbi:MAG: ubiquinone/menaquinone biosynthesis methyltransferase [Thermoanaerobaculia bacterium]|nr:ubiquinone/menaquinone biosynthesis methyltransferase [Thermoanaerobaculia bacterium]
MVDAPTPEDKSGPKVQAMFGSVAPVYDRLNHLLSLSLDRWWRRRSSRSLTEAQGGILAMRVLALCCGTGDQAISLRHRGHKVVAADFCIPMLALANPKFDRVEAPRPGPLAADAMRLPFADETFDALTVSFGIRNVADLGVALDEIRRVLVPGGQVRILEFTMPRNPIIGVGYRFYFRHILPLIGRALSRHDSAYSYLPGSVLEFPQRGGFTEYLERSGLVGSGWQELSFGTVCLYSATRP